MTFPGKNWDSQFGFPTPESTPETSACRTFRVPASDEWQGALMGAVELLMNPKNWYNWGALTPDEAADAWQTIINQAYEDSLILGCPTDTVDAPYWDTDSDVDDEMDIAAQPWYGYVLDAEAPAGELTFFENAALWVFTGFLAVGVDLNVAIVFNTIAPKFVLAVRSGDLAELIRILVDGEDAARVDTSAYAAGDIINVPIIADPDLDTHELMIVQQSSYDLVFSAVTEIV